MSDFSRSTSPYERTERDAGWKYGGEHQSSRSTCGRWTAVRSFVIATDGISTRPDWASPPPSPVKHCAVICCRSLNLIDLRIRCSTESCSSWLLSKTRLIYYVNSSVCRCLSHSVYFQLACVLTDPISSKPKLENVSAVRCISR